MKNIIICGLLCALVGCASKEILQTCKFVDEDGRFLTVEYGHSDTPHTSTFISPINGKEMEMSSKLFVNVDMPKVSFSAYQCMNFLTTGTLYKTDDEELIFHANGFTCRVYRQNDDEKYEPIFSGVLCQPGQGE